MHLTLSAFTHAQTCAHKPAQNKTKQNQTRKNIWMCSAFLSQQLLTFYVLSLRRRIYPLILQLV